MSETLNALDDMSRVLATALQEDDWNRIAGLDEELRGLCEQAMAEVRDGTLSGESVKTRLDHLQALYENAKAKAVQSRDKAEAALQQLGKGHRAASTYIANTSGDDERDA